MSGLKLYELSDMYRAAMAQIEAQAEANEGVYSDDWSEFLDAIQEPLREKALNIGRWIKQERAEAEAIKAEEKKLSERRHTAEAKADRLESYLIANLTAGEVLKDANTTLTWRKSAQVIINDLNAIPEGFIKIEKSADKTSIKEMIKKGIIIRGAELVNKLNLQIK